MPSFWIPGREPRQVPTGSPPVGIFRPGQAPDPEKVAAIRLVGLRRRWPQASADTLGAMAAAGPEIVRGADPGTLERLAALEPGRSVADLLAYRARFREYVRVVLGQRQPVTPPLPPLPDDLPF